MYLQPEGRVGGAALVVLSELGAFAVKTAE